jgi:hypothetical protein
VYPLVIISAKGLLRYLPSIEYPADVLAESGDRVMFQVTREQLRMLIASGGVIGVGSSGRVKRLRVNKLTAACVEHNTQESAPQETSYSHESLKLTYREKIVNQPYTLKRLVDGAFERWTGEEKFTRGRFNPDAIPAPITPHLRG